MKFDIVKESSIERTFRVESLGSMFDVPIEDKLATRVSGEINLDERSWSVGLIVGPSGSGKTLALKALFGESEKLEWNSRSVIDDFTSTLSMESIASVCSSVGFNTIPSWLRPFSVLSNGEKFRAEVARALLGNSGGPVLIDEFTSVVDRQIAQITSHAVQRYIRENSRRLVAASCHYDIIDWLQPDWILEPGNPSRFQWRELQRRPPLTVSIRRIPYEAWSLFKNYHYMTPELNRAARCYGLFVQDMRGADCSGESSLVPSTQHTSGKDGVVLHESDSIFSDSSRLGSSSYEESLGVRSGVVKSSSGDNRTDSRLVRIPSSEHTSGEARSGSCRGNTEVAGSERILHGPRSRIASFLGTLHRPHPKIHDIIGVSRAVTLPDWQGLGLAFVLVETVAAAYRALGKRVHNYPNHPAYIRSHQRSKNWIQVKNPGSYSPARGSSSTVRGFGGKRCAVFMYNGPALDRSEAEKLIGGE